MDLTSLLAPLQPDAPCGDDLEYDTAFSALEAQLATAYAERVVGPEDGTGADWAQIAASAHTLLGRSRDLRIAATLATALLHTEGVAGFARGLSLLHGLLLTHWEHVHPQLGAQGDGDGVMRANALRTLCDPRSVLAPLRTVPLLVVKGLPPVCLRDLQQAASGTQPPAGQADAAVMDAVCQGCDFDMFESTCRVVGEACGDVAGIESLFAERASAAGVRLSELLTQLDAMKRLLAARLAPRLAERAPSSTEPGELQPSAAELLLPARTRGDALSTRADVVRELERLCAYYERYEPSSPVPMLLRRAKRLTSMPFFELVRELAPGGTAELETLRGPITTEES